MRSSFVAALCMCAAFLSAQRSLGAPREDPFTTGQTLYDACESEGPGELVCVSYLRGMWEGVIMVESVTQRDRAKRTFCSPKAGAVSGAQLRMVYATWARANAQMLHNTARECAGIALMTAFPCE